MSGLMYEAEVRGANSVWTVRSVTGIPTSGEQPDVRCQHCHGAVRVHKQQVPHGPADHVEHVSSSDAAHCVGGDAYKPPHRMSATPVT